MARTYLFWRFSKSNRKFFVLQNPYSRLLWIEFHRVIFGVLNAVVIRDIGAIVKNSRACISFGHFWFVLFSEPFFVVVDLCTAALYTRRICFARLNQKKQNVYTRFLLIQNVIVCVPQQQGIHCNYSGYVFFFS